MILIVDTPVGTMTLALALQTSDVAQFHPLHDYQFAYSTSIFNGEFEYWKASGPLSHELIFLDVHKTDFSC